MDKNVTSDLDQAIAFIERCHDESKWLASNGFGSFARDHHFAASQTYEFLLTRLKARDFTVACNFDDFVRSNVENNKKLDELWASSPVIASDVVASPPEPDLSVLLLDDQDHPDEPPATVKLSLDLAKTWAVILLDDEPIVVAKLDRVHGWSINHIANYYQRPPKFSWEDYDALAEILALSTGELLVKIKTVLDDTTYGDDYGPFEIVTPKLLKT